MWHKICVILIGGAFANIVTTPDYETDAPAMLAQLAGINLAVLSSALAVALAGGLLRRVPRAEKSN